MLCFIRSGLHLMNIVCFGGIKKTIEPIRMRRKQMHSQQIF